MLKILVKISEKYKNNLNSKYSQKILDHFKISGTDSFKIAWKRADQKATETTGDLIGDEIADVLGKLYNDKITITALGSNPNTAP